MDLLFPLRRVIARARLAPRSPRGAHAIAAIPACAILALAATACRNRDAPRPRDAALAVDAGPLDAPAVDDAAVDAPPVDAAAAPAPTKLVASGDSTCAVLSDLTVRCWGGNAHGQLGNGQTTDAAAPVAPEIRAVVDLQLADATACALLDDASVACWGQIAWHARGGDLLRPTGVLGVIGVKRIFVLPGRACARVADDSLVCWGNVNARGHFAAGAAHRPPTPVVGLDHVAGLTAAGAFSDDGRMWRWGSDGTPHRLDTSGVQEIAARDGTVCGRLDNGRVVCADSGRCGPPPAASSSPAQPTSPAAPARPAPPAGVPARPGAHSAKPSKLGPPAKPARPAAAAAPAAGAGEPVLSPAFTPARQLAFDVGFCVVNTLGRLQCGDGCRKLDPIALERVDTIVSRCAILKSSTISCFDGAKFVAVPGVKRSSLLAVGRAHACALFGDHLACWGDNAHHQLGDFAVTR